MSRKYPHMDGGRNKRINRERQSYAHVQSFHYAHQVREMKEQNAAKIEAFKAEYPEEAMQEIRKGTARK